LQSSEILLLGALIILITFEIVDLRNIRNNIQKNKLKLLFKSISETNIELYMEQIVFE